MGPCLRVLPVVVGLLALGAPRPVSAAEMRFALDPAQSSLAIASGSGFTLALGQRTLTANGANPIATGFGDVALDWTAPSEGSGASLPDGTTGNGLRTFVTGVVVADLAEDLSTIAFRRERSVLELGDSGAWRPGPPGGSASAPGPAELAVEWADAGTGVSGRLAVRRAVLSIDTAGATLPLTPAGGDTRTFAAGCTAGACPRYRLEESRIDAELLPGSVTRDGVRTTHAPMASAAGTQGTLAPEGDGYRLTIPVAVTVPLVATDFFSALPASGEVVLTGQLVAVPEAGGALAGLAALAALVALSARARLRHVALRLRLPLLALLPALLPLGCPSCPPWDPERSLSAWVASSGCLNLSIRYGEVGGPSFLEQVYPTCNFFGGGGTIGTNLAEFRSFPQIHHQDDGWQGFLSGGVVTRLEATPTPSSKTLEAVYSYRYSLTYAPSDQSGSLAPKLQFQPLKLSFGAARGEFLDGGVVVSGYGTPVAAAPDGVWREMELNPLGGTLDFDFTVTAHRRNAGLGDQRLALRYQLQPNDCRSNRDCKDSPIGDRCVDDGVCTTGGVGQSCWHSTQCAPGLHCYAGVCGVRLF